MSDIFLDNLSDDMNNYPNNNIEIIRDDKKVQCYFLGKEEERLFVEIDFQAKTTTLFPINTIEDSSKFLKPKYEKIDRFVFEDYDIDIDKNEYNNEETIYGLPEIFIKTLKYGLGFIKQYRLIADIISHYFTNCKTIIFSKNRQTYIEDECLIINDYDLDTIRRGINRNQELYQKEAKEAKEAFVYDVLLHEINPDKYPELRKKPQKDIIYKILKNTDFKKSNISQKDKQSLSALKDSTDLSYFTILTAEFEKKLSEKHNESAYQTLFEENPLLLTMIVGSPFVQFKNQAYVGGKSFDNSNGQYPDFLQKHKITNNTFIVEIKTPHTLLIEKKPYRETGVYSASKDLSGAVSQLLTQKYQLETDIASLIKNAEDREVETYNVQGLIIIGKLSDLEEKTMKRSFELYRNNQKNLRIMTYDECLEQLKSFVDLLAKGESINPFNR